MLTNHKQKLQSPGVGRVHMFLFSLSRNNFLFETFCLNLLLGAIRTNGKLFHMQMDWQDPKMLTTFVSYLKLKPQLRYIFCNKDLSDLLTVRLPLKLWILCVRFWLPRKAKKIAIDSTLSILTIVISENLNLLNWPKL